MQLALNVILAAPGEKLSSERARLKSNVLNQASTNDRRRRYITELRNGKKKKKKKKKECSACFRLRNLPF